MHTRCVGVFHRHPCLHYFWSSPNAVYSQVASSCTVLASGHFRVWPQGGVSPPTCVQPDEHATARCAHVRERTRFLRARTRSRRRRRHQDATRRELQRIALQRGPGAAQRAAAQCRAPHTQHSTPFCSAALHTTPRNTTPCNSMQLHSPAFHDHAMASRLI
jgi:hypothetical protein